MNKKVKGTVNMIVSNTSSRKSPSGSLSSPKSTLIFSVRIEEGNEAGGVCGFKSGSEGAGRRISEGCRRGISVCSSSALRLYLIVNTYDRLTAVVYAPDGDSGTSSTIAIVLVTGRVNG
jgi:hypothetical protein